jgi:hypothetical protein
MPHTDLDAPEGLLYTSTVTKERGFKEPTAAALKVA